MARDRDERDSKYVRLTGLWESKKRGLFSGKLREQDIEKLVEKIDEAKDAGSDLIFFLWENNDKRGRKDPDYTLQVAVAEDAGVGTGRGSYGRDRGRDRRPARDDREEGRDRDRDRDRDDHRDDDRGRGKEDEPDEEPEEEPEEREERAEKPKSSKAPAKGSKSAPPAKAKAKPKDDNW